MNLKAAVSLVGVTWFFVILIIEVNVGNGPLDHYEYFLLTA